MKKIFVLLFLSSPFFAKAQWSTSDPNSTFSYTGNVGIGTSSPNAKLQVVKSNGTVLGLSGNTNGYVGADILICRVTIDG
jgi:hypothetical protein